MKRITFLIIHLFLCIQLGAQERFFEFIPGWSCSHVEEANDGFQSIGLGGSTYSEPFMHSLISSKLNLSGEVVNTFETVLDTTASLSINNRNQIFTPYSDGYIVIGKAITTVEDERHSLIVWYNEEMTEVLDYRLYNLGNGESFHAIAAVNDTTLMIGALIQPTSETYAHASLINMDMEGNIRWQQDYPCGTDCIRTVQQVLPTSDGGYILACKQQVDYIGSSTFGWFSHAVFIKTDSLGNEEWTITPGDEENYKLIPGGVVETDDGNILVSYSNPDKYYIPNGGTANTDSNDSTTVFIEKYTLDEGEFLWKDSLINNIPFGLVYGEFGVRSYPYHLTQMQPTQDGNVLITGTTRLGAVLIKVNQEGEFIWFREHMPYDWASNENTAEIQETRAYGTTQTSDGGYIIGGEYISSPGNIFPESYQSAFVLKVDEFGCLEPDCQLSDNVEELQDLGKRMTVFPNPTQGKLEVQFAISTSGILTVTDVMGKISSVHQINNIQQYSLDLDSGKNGLYLLRFVSESGAVYVERILKQ